MSFGRVWLLCFVSGCLIWGEWVSATYAQLLAMPPSTAKAEQPLPYNDLHFEQPRNVGPSAIGTVPGRTTGQFQQLGPEFRPNDRPASYGAAPYGLPSLPTPANATPPQRPTPGSNSRQFLDMNVAAEQPPFYGDCWTWQFLPDGLMYKSYLAAGRESRFASKWIYEQDDGWLWDVALGGRVGVLRYGTEDDAWPEGWQLDVEGAAFPRLDLENDRDMVSTDFRFGVPLTARQGPWEGKFAYYHLSSHLADEYLQRHPGALATRINYVRDTLVLGIALRLAPDLRLYSEAGYAFWTDGGSQPWEFQFGVDYSPVLLTGALPAPFFAVGGRIREEVDYGGNFTVQAGVQWRGRSGHIFRLGAHYFNGMSDQYQFFNQHEEQIGVGLWYDY